MIKIIKQLMLCMACVPPLAWSAVADDLTFYPSKEQQVKRITWLVVENPHQACIELSAQYRSPFDPDQKIAACAVFSTGTEPCVVVTGEFTSLATLGHEVRHCFEGRWHD